MAETIEIQAIVGARRVTREQVRAWESRRANAVLNKMTARLGPRALAELLPDRPIETLSAAPLETRRKALTDLKTRLGHAGIYAMLKRELAFSERTARTAVAVSRGRTQHSVTRLSAPGRSAERFAAWFTNLVVVDDEPPMVDSCPDHYLQRGLPDGRHEVVETTGGSPMPSRFVIDYTRTEALTIPVDPRYPIQIAGQALLDDGLTIGGVRHQFRDNEGTLEALLTVQFPAALPARLIREHRWHLAVEFSNWLLASV
ncbi:hypothetical protein [Nocardia tenerifensis]|nr:hypothetical protein [Nocardia tenerifensis]